MEGISKTVLKEGDGATPSPGREVSVHFVGKYIDEKGVEVVFNSSRERNDPLRFTIGKDHTIPGLENGVKGMRVGELARIVVKPEQAFGPMGNPHGFHGSGKAIPANTALIFDTELLSVDDSVGSDAIFSDPAEKYEAALKRKEEGNALFKKKKNSQASAKWSAAISLLLGIKSGPPNPNINGKEIDNLLLSLHNNMAHVSLLNNDFTNALRHSKEVLSIDDKNTKALFRRGKAHKELRNFEEAGDDFQRCLKLIREREKREGEGEGGKREGGGTIKAILVEIESLKPLLKEEEKETQKFWKGTFDRLEEKKEELYTQEDIQKIFQDEKESRMRKCHICDEEVEDIQLARHVIKKHSEKPKK